MTEKRFKFDRFRTRICDSETGEELTGGYELEEVLNNLHEEKEYWKKRCLFVENKYGEKPNMIGFIGNGRMTAKRFTYNGDTCFVCDNVTGYCYHMFKDKDGREIEELLNNLNEEKKTNKRIVIELDKLLNKYGLSFEELEDAIQYYVEDRGAR